MEECVKQHKSQGQNKNPTKNGDLGTDTNLCGVRPSIYDRIGHKNTLISQNILLFGILSTHTYP